MYTGLIDLDIYWQFNFKKIPYHKLVEVHNVYQNYILFY